MQCASNSALPYRYPATQNGYDVGYLKQQDLISQQSAHQSQQQLPTHLQASTTQFSNRAPQLAWGNHPNYQKCQTYPPTQLRQKFTASNAYRDWDIPEDATNPPIRDWQVEKTRNLSAEIRPIGFERDHCHDYESHIQRGVPENMERLTLSATSRPSPTNAGRAIKSNTATTVSDRAIYTKQQQDDTREDDSSDDETMPQKPNKYTVQIEDHKSKACKYIRQKTRSGIKFKVIKGIAHEEMTGERKVENQEIQYYQKELLRVCRCGKYESLEHYADQGRNNDCPGYEIHYSRKCKWKAYEDAVTKRRVLIRLCKCHRPTFMTKGATI